MESVGRLYCTECEAQLRRGRPPGLCEPCARKGLDVRRALPPSFYDNPKVKAALGAYDFGRFFKMLRRYTGWTQETLGGIVDLTQADISKMERGKWNLQDITIIRRFADRLGIPSALLGFGPTVEDGDLERKVASWVDRRKFNGHVAGLFLSIAGASGLDLDRLTALLSHARPTGTRHVGVADVALIEQVTAGFVRQDYAGGSGAIRHATVSFLDSVVPLLGAQVPGELRPRLMIATGRLATIAGWAGFEVEDHEAARRLWLIALDLARDAGDPQGADLASFLLKNMARQALHMDSPDEALHFVRIGHTAADTQAISASTACALANIQAQAHAAWGDTAACDRALGQAEEQFTRIDPAASPPWTAYLTETQLAAYQGSAYYMLAAQSGQDPRAAGRAVLLLRQAVDQFGPDRAKARARSLPDLAGAHALAGDPDTAVTLGHQAVDAITTLSSPRLHSQLRTLHAVLQPLHASPGVAELRDRLVATTTA